MAANQTIHQSTPLRIMAALNVLDRREVLEFTFLKAIMDLTDGNLSAHLDTLAKAGYIDVEKLFVGRRPRTRVKATANGRRAFRTHAAFLRAILDVAEKPPRRI